MNISELDALAKENGGRARFSVFDLPIEKQKEFAKQDGLSFDEWVKKTKDFFEQSEKIQKQFELALAKAKT